MNLPVRRAHHGARPDRVPRLPTGQTWRDRYCELKGGRATRPRPIPSKTRSVSPATGSTNRGGLCTAGTAIEQSHPKTKEKSRFGWYRRPASPVTFVTFAEAGAFDNARKLRIGRSQPDAAVRELSCASARTEDRVGAFAAYSVLVDRGSVSETAPYAPGADSCDFAVHNEAADTTVTFAFPARRRGRVGWLGKNEGLTGCGRRCAQLDGRLIRIHHNLDAFGRAAPRAVGQPIPRACATLGRALTRNGPRCKARHTHSAFITARKAVWAIDGVQQRKTGSAEPVKRQRTRPRCTRVAASVTPCQHRQTNRQSGRLPSTSDTA